MDNEHIFKVILSLTIALEVKVNQVSGMKSWKPPGSPPPISRLKLGKQRTPRHRKAMKIDIQGRLLHTCHHCKWQ